MLPVCGCETMPKSIYIAKQEKQHESQEFDIWKLKLPLNDVQVLTIFWWEPQWWQRLNDAFIGITLTLELDFLFFCSFFQAACLRMWNNDAINICCKTRKRTQTPGIRQLKVEATTKIFLCSTNSAQLCFEHNFCLMVKDIHITKSYNTSTVRRLDQL